MFKRPVTYENFDGETVTEEFHFHISKTDLIDLDLSQGEGGLKEMIESIFETKDEKGLVDIFKKMVLLAYGERSEDGKRFVKNDEIREAFSYTAAYDALFIELATNDGAAAEFILGALPRDLGREAGKAFGETKDTPDVEIVDETTKPINDILPPTT